MSALVDSGDAYRSDLRSAGMKPSEVGEERGEKR